MIARGRLDRAAVFIARLYALSASSPHSWRRAESIGRDIGLAGLPLEQALDDAEKAGLIDRREDDPGLIMMTAAGTVRRRNKDQGALADGELRPIEGVGVGRSAMPTAVDPVLHGARLSPGLRHVLFRIGNQPPAAGGHSSATTGLGTWHSARAFPHHAKQQQRMHVDRASPLATRGSPPVARPPERPKDTDEKAARRLVRCLLALDVVTFVLLVLAAGLFISLAL